MAKALLDVADTLGEAISERGLTLAGPAFDERATAWADPERVRQILVNLIMNAVKYTPAHGGTITLGCAAQGNMVLTQVTDTGPGIDPAQLESIFEPFVQLTASRQRAISRRFVQDFPDKSGSRDCFPAVPPQCMGSPFMTWETSMHETQMVWIGRRR